VCVDIQTDFESHRKSPELLRFHPDYAGSAYWARFLMRRLKHSMECILQATGLPPSHLAADSKAQYDSLISAMEDYIFKAHQDWSLLHQTPFEERLNSVLMARGKDNSLSVKFDKDISRLLAEAHYWQKLKLDVPFHAQEIFSRREELRTIRENVFLVVRFIIMRPC
jgi:dynein heavy chain